MLRETDVSDAMHGYSAQIFFLRATLLSSVFFLRRLTAETRPPGFMPLAVQKQMFGNVVDSLFFKADLQVKVDALLSARSLGRSDPRGRVKTHSSIRGQRQYIVGSMSVMKQVGCQCDLRYQNNIMCVSWHFLLVAQLVVQIAG